MLLSGYERRTYHCVVCGDFDVSTEGYHSCKCGIYQGLQQGFERGLAKHYDCGDFPFPKAVYKTTEKRVNDFDFLTDEENALMDKIESDFYLFDDHDADVTIFRSETKMPDGRTETYHFNFEIEQNKWIQYAPTKTNSVYLGIDLLDKSTRHTVIERLEVFYDTMLKVADGRLDLFKDSKAMQEKYEWQNNYEMIKVDKFVFYPSKETV